MVWGGGGGQRGRGGSQVSVESVNLFLKKIIENWSTCGCRGVGDVVVKTSQTSQTSFLVGSFQLPFAVQGSTRVPSV